MVALLNNIHGYFILRTVNNTFNSKFYFVIRLITELALLYISICIVTGRQITFEKLAGISKADALYKRARFFTLIIDFFSIIECIFLLASARKLIKTKRRTNINELREGTAYGAVGASSRPYTEVLDSSQRRSVNGDTTNI